MAGLWDGTCAEPDARTIWFENIVAVEVAAGYVIFVTAPPDFGNGFTESASGYLVFSGTNIVRSRMRIRRDPRTGYLRFGV